jgi:hypothetical protein
MPVLQLTAVFQDVLDPCRGTAHTRAPSGASY